VLREVGEQSQELTFLYPQAAPGWHPEAAQALAQASISRGWT
jgi:hypothetical protein